VELETIFLLLQTENRESLLLACSAPWAIAQIGIRSSLPKTRPIFIVFGLFSQNALDFLSFWIIFQMQTNA
jgi:hypothetical protein